MADIIDITDEPELVNGADNTTQENLLPHPEWSDYFKKIGENKRNSGMYYALCKLCMGRKHISCSYGSPWNLRRHVSVKYISI